MRACAADAILTSHTSGIGLCAARASEFHLHYAHTQNHHTHTHHAPAIPHSHTHRQTRFWLMRLTRNFSKAFPDDTEHTHTQMRARHVRACITAQNTAFSYRVKCGSVKVDFNLCCVRAFSGRAAAAADYLSGFQISFGSRGPARRYIMTNRFSSDTIALFSKALRSAKFHIRDEGQ